MIICGDFGFWDESGEQRYWRKWLSGKVQFITPDIIHLMRGQVYDLEGRRFFTFGGAKSHDISGGILEPDDPEFRKKKRNLDRCGWKVDMIVSHCCPSSIQKEICGNRCESDALTKYFEKIKDRCEFGKWMFGHYHENRNVGRKFAVVYEQIVRVV